MELIEKIRAEIENWLKEYAEDSQFELGERHGYKRVLSLLDTLQEPDRPEPYNPTYDEAYLNEKIKKATESWKGVDVNKMLAECRGYDEPEVEVDLEKEMDEYFEKMVVQEHENIFEDTYHMIAKHFFEFGKNAKK